MLPKVGDRISVQGHVGTVCFVGSVAGTKGEWIGLEWDDQARGRHSGEKDGIQYFGVSRPGAGSFVRPRKVDPLISLEEAVQHRYGVRLDGNEETSTFVDSKQQAITVELVGADKAFEKQRQFEQLRSVCVPGAAVRGAENPAGLSAMLPAATELDLSRTLFPTWESVSAVVAQLPALKVLRLCGMAFPAVDTEIKEHKTESEIVTLPRMSTLFYNLCALSFPKGRAAPQVVGMNLIFPHLTELHLGGNEIVTLTDKSGQCFFPKTLEHLNVEDNRIEDWTELLALSTLPALTRLNVAKNAISSIHGVFEAAGFRALEALNVSRNALAEWSSINELRGFSALKEIVVGHNPVFESEKSLHARQCIISRVRAAQRVNRTVVESMERTIAERFYLTRHAAEWWDAKVKGEAAISELEAAHPTFRELVNIHGEPDRPKAAVVALKAGFVGLRATTRSGLAVPRVQMPQTTTISRLRLVLKAKDVLSLQNLTSARLQYIDDDPEIHAINLDDDMRDLIFYGIKSGEVRVQDSAADDGP